jgi:hypothetical protein
VSLSWLPPLRLHDELLIIGYEARLHLTHTTCNVSSRIIISGKITGKGSFLCVTSFNSLIIMLIPQVLGVTYYANKTIVNSYTLYKGGSIEVNQIIQLE